MLIGDEDEESVAVEEEEDPFELEMGNVSFRFFSSIASLVFTFSLLTLSG